MFGVSAPPPPAYPEGDTVVVILVLCRVDLSLSSAGRVRVEKAKSRDLWGYLASGAGSGKSGCMLTGGGGGLVGAVGCGAVAVGAVSSGVMGADVGDGDRETSQVTFPSAASCMAWSS